MKSLGEMRGRKGERHCKATWFYGMDRCFFFHLVVIKIACGFFIELISKIE
jgi:hypothetical protein